ncbi:hypothetical protein CGMCC3_g16389 [Colletotrichum fructicola]|nr:uncharacterized protein CGMCC3_g16389 [Colletotrichum fructicola]KAE9567471.1 hypothetical protein CGMCC3_g16389 [Colletotrichum fructicola]
MITPKDDEQSILSAIDRFVACPGEDKATVADCVNQYIHLEDNASARFDIVTLRARLPVDAVNIIITHYKPSHGFPPRPASQNWLKRRPFYTALNDLATCCPDFAEARPLLQEQADVRRASISKTQVVDKNAQGIVLHDVKAVLNRLRTAPVPPLSPEQGRSDEAKHTVIDDNLDDTSTSLHQTVFQPAAAGSEDNQSLQDVQQQSPIEPDPLDWPQTGA